jgi:hypothetical protein
VGVTSRLMAWLKVLNSSLMIVLSAHQSESVRGPCSFIISIRPSLPEQTRALSGDHHFWRLWIAGMQTLLRVMNESHSPIRMACLLILARAPHLMRSFMVSLISSVWKIWQPLTRFSNMAVLHRFSLWPSSVGCLPSLMPPLPDDPDDFDEAAVRAEEDDEEEEEEEEEEEAAPADHPLRYCHVVKRE